MDTRTGEIVRLTPEQVQAMKEPERRHFMPLTMNEAERLSKVPRAQRRAWARQRRKEERRERQRAQAGGC